MFSVEPPSGVIDPQGTLKLIVTATIDDCLRYHMCCVYMCLLHTWVKTT